MKDPTVADDTREVGQVHVIVMTRLQEVAQRQEVVVACRRKGILGRVDATARHGYVGLLRRVRRGGRSLAAAPHGVNLEPKTCRRPRRLVDTLIVGLLFRSSGR